MIEVRDWKTHPATEAELQDLNAEEAIPDVFRSRKRWRRGSWEARPCKLCKMPIRFMNTEKGKAMPVDAWAIRLTAKDFAIEEGLPGPQLIDAAGRVRAFRGPGVGFRTHWGTCPHADAFRNRDRKKPPSQVEASPSNFLHRLEYVEAALKKLSSVRSAHRPELRELFRYSKRSREIFSEAIEEQS